MKKTNTNKIEMLKIKALLYGASGKGKTFSARTLPEGKTLIISAESGLLALSGKNYDVAEIEKWDDLKEVFKLLETPESQKRFDFVFIDSLTEINEMCKQHIVEKERPDKRGNIGKVYDDILDMQDWGLLHAKMSKAIRGFRDLPYNIIFTCLEDSDKDERTGAVAVLPSLNGKLKSNINQYFDEVFRAVSIDTGDETGYYFLTRTTEKSLAKDRSGQLEKKESPDWTAIINKIKKGLGGKK